MNYEVLYCGLGRVIKFSPSIASIAPVQLNFNFKYLITAQKQALQKVGPDAHMHIEGLYHKTN